MKFFAFFLPQFHEIPENNEWWGEGFTEWTNVKKAKPLYEGHIQPKIPLNYNYYNLMEKQTMEWQTQLMHKYGIDGMVYYHYYFKGKKLLEKPCENLLRWKEIEQPFFFCWANHSWIRSWNGTKEMLLEQTYGVENDWEKHFQYLLPFFKDSRYEKKDNMPLFMLFNTNFIEKNAMFQYFDRRCKEEGFSGLYLIETYGGTRKICRLKKDVQNFKNHCSSVTKDIMFREPATASTDYDRNNPFFHLKRIKNGVFRLLNNTSNKSGTLRLYQGDKILGEAFRHEAKLRGLKGLFFEWDNTPRHGSRGYVITPVSKTLVMQYLDKIQNDKYVFVNAWNEWCEGMILEPTKQNGYRYLEWIKEWKGKHIQ